MPNKNSSLSDILMDSISRRGKIDIDDWRQYYNEAETEEERLDVIWKTTLVTLSTIVSHREDHRILNKNLAVTQTKINRMLSAGLIGAMIILGLVLIQVGISPIITVASTGLATLTGLSVNLIVAKNGNNGKS